MQLHATENESTPVEKQEGVSRSQELWAAAVRFTRDRSPGTFDQWFGGIQFEGLIDGILSLRARDEFVRDWVEEHFMPTLSDHLRSQTGWSIRTTWTVGGDLDAPVSQGERAPAPERTQAFERGASERPASERTERGHAPDRNERSRISVAPPPVEGLNPKSTFQNFVIGPSNQLAHAAAVACAGGGGPKHNPLFLCGGTGLGKTHLVHAVAHRVRNEKPSTRIIYVSAEKFVNEFVQALQDQRMNEFRSRYRDRCDLLLVDDIQFLASKTQTQEEFFHAFNALHQADKQIIVTSDKYPQQLERMEERLVSRFSWGLVADVQMPELETRVAILRKKAQFEQIELSDEVILLLAQAVRSNIRELEGTLIRLAAKSSLMRKTVDVEFVKQELSAAGAHRLSEASIDDIQRIVCHHFKLRSGDLLSKDRHKSIAFARHIAMYLCKQRLRCSFPEVGRAFGGRDHTTVISAVRKVEHLRGTDAEMRAHLDAIERKLSSS
jgi:chromosomal replication initiator protein